MTKAHPTDAEIEAAKQRTRYSLTAAHENSDSIRIAFQWFDAQDTVRGRGDDSLNLKCQIEGWGGFYVPRASVEIAAELHPRIRGTYPGFNLSARRVVPLSSRLDGIAEARTQSYRMSEALAYHFLELPDGTRRKLTRAEQAEFRV